MKINGKTVEPNKEILVLPRPNADIVIVAAAVTDESPFDKLCPRPEAPVRVKRGGGKIEDVEDPDYVRELGIYANKKFAWLIVTSLRATPGMEWETVKYEDEGSWTGWADEMKASGLNDREIQLVIAAVLTANSMNEQKLDEARARFLLTQAAPDEK